MGLALCWYALNASILFTQLIPVQPAVQHTISRRSQSTKTVQLDSRPSNDEDGCKNRSSIPRGPMHQRRQMEDLQELIVLGHQVKRQPWTQHRRDMRHIPRERGYERRASTRRVNPSGPRRETDSVETLCSRGKVPV